MKIEIELLKMCADIFEEINKVSWNENSIWNENNYYETERKVLNFLEKNICDCEPFHSCEKCKPRTEWKDPLLFKPSDSEYWILNTLTNFIKKGSQYINKLNEEFECEDGEILYFQNTMYAEIRPPQAP